MRFAKAEELLKLAFAMQASTEGVALSDIEEMFDVTRRTAMRMRDAVARVFPQMDEMVGENHIKRWHIPAAVTNRHINLLPDELASLDVAVKKFTSDGMQLHARHLQALAAKVKSLQRTDHSRRLETDLEAMIEAEGLAARPGPRPKIMLEHMHTLREAIKACHIVELKYRPKGKKVAEPKRVCPYGFLYGHRHYLVGGGAEKGREDSHYLFSLSQIEAVTVTLDSFCRCKDFNLQDFAEQSFGVWMEKPQEVVWKFTPKAASAARDFVFHPSQKIEEKKDGSLIVRFKAGGLLEMAWHVLTWGDQVEVIKPKGLKAMLKGKRPKWKGLP
ncbi:MAG: WYL domain-containing protein [Alphaproteobacteria bacterium]|nr:WYL domain-containing protein [Alphaproteobacteria bacterium]